MPPYFDKCLEPGGNPGNRVNAKAHSPAAGAIGRLVPWSMDGIWRPSCSSPWCALVQSVLIIYFGAVRMCHMVLSWASWACWQPGARTQSGGREGKESWAPRQPEHPVRRQRWVPLPASPKYFNCSRVQKQGTHCRGKWSGKCASSGQRGASAYLVAGARGAVGLENILQTQPPDGAVHGAPPSEQAPRWPPQPGPSTFHLLLHRSALVESGVNTRRI